MSAGEESFLIGCAFLNKPSDLSSGGWASLGGQEAFKFSTLDSLSRLAPVWVTSMQEATFRSENGDAYGFLRHAGFLPTPVSAIADELTHSQAESKAVSAARVSQVLTRVLSLADRIAPASACLAQKGVAPQSLTEVLRSLVASTHRTDPPPAEVASSMHELFRNPPALGAPAAGEITVRIPAKRLALAEAAFATEVPGALWKRVGVNEYPNLLSWAIGNKKPILARVSVKRLHQGVKGRGLDELARGPVRWMALPEITAMSKVAELQSELVFVADDTVPPAASLLVPPPVFSAAAAGSISAALFAETYMHAAQSPVVSGHAVEAAGKTPSVRAAWLLSATRAIMLREAVALSKGGFSVIAFGSSHVLVSAPKTALVALRRAIADSAFLSYPTSLRQQEDDHAETFRQRALASRDEHS